VIPKAILITNEKKSSFAVVGNPITNRFVMGPIRKPALRAALNFLVNVKTITNLSKNALLS
jgi:hypothetical protein